jgi:hypothetical protein
MRWFLGTAGVVVLVIVVVCWVNVVRAHRTVDSRLLIVVPGKGVIGFAEIGMPIKTMRHRIPDAVDPYNDRRYAKIVGQDTWTHGSVRYISPRLGIELCSDDSRIKVRAVGCNDGSDHWPPDQNTHEFGGQLVYGGETNKLIGLERSTIVRLFGRPVATATFTNSMDFVMDSGANGRSSSITFFENELLLYPMQGIGFSLWDDKVKRVRIEAPSRSALNDIGRTPRL